MRTSYSRCRAADRAQRRLRRPHDDRSTRSPRWSSRRALSIARTPTSNGSDRRRTMKIHVLTAIARAYAFALAIAFAIAVAVPAAAYAQSEPQRAWSPPRTSWGDPLIEGTYTNKDEYGTPLERPDEFAGKRLEDFGPAEMAALRAERQRRAVETAASIGGTAEEDTGAGPPHWYEHLEAENSQPWFVIEPADGKMPAMTEAARQRQEAQRATRSKRAAPDSYADMSNYDRCISLGMPG